MQLENPLLGFEFYSPGPVENLYNYLYIFYLLQMLLDINVNAEADKSHTAECEHLLQGVLENKRLTLRSHEAKMLEKIHEAIFRMLDDTWGGGGAERFI